MTNSELNHRLLTEAELVMEETTRALLDLSERLAIAQTYVRSQGYHGLVTELATDYQTNRQQIYAILRAVEHGFAPRNRSLFILGVSVGGHSTRLR